MALLVATTVLATIVVPGVHAQVAPPDTPGAADPAPDGGLDDRIELTVTHFTGVLGPGSVPSHDDPEGMTQRPGDLELRALVENIGDLPLDSLQLVVEVHPPATTRAALRQALEGGLTTQPLHVHNPPIRDNEALEPGDIAGVEDTFVRTDVDWASGAGGVHPVRIAVTRGTEVHAEAVTAVVWLGHDPSDPLLTSVVWPLDGQPWRAAGGTYPEGADREIRPGGRLDVLLSAAEQPAATSVVLAPTAHLLEDLGDRSDGFEATSRQDGGSIEVRSVPASDAEARRASATLRRIRELAEELRHPPATGTYADADIDALARSGTDARDLAATAATEGRRRTQLTLGTEIDSSTHIVHGPIEIGVLDLLPGENVLLPPAALDLPSLDEDPDLGDPVRRLQAPAGRVLTGLLADPYLDQALRQRDHPGGTVLAAHRPVAESAMAYFAAPGVADRAMILAPPATWDPTPKLADELLAGLSRAPWLRLDGLGRVAANARRSTQTVEFGGSENEPFSADFLSSLDAAARGIEGAEAALDGTDRRLDERPPTDLHDDLLRATSRWFRGGTEGSALVRDVQRAVDSTFGDVEVTTGSVTLTSDTGQVPITLRRTRGGPIRVAVTVESGGGLVWPDDRHSEPLLLEEDTSQTVSFPTRAQSTGTFPVTVRVTDPSRTYELSATTMSVHSRAISRPALLATGGLIGVLLLIGALRRRDRTSNDGGAPLSVVDADEPAGR